MALATVQGVQWSTAAATMDLNAALTTALNKLKTFCANNAAKYDCFQWSVGVDLPTGNFTFAASAQVYPAAFATLRDAHLALSYPTVSTAL